MLCPLKYSPVLGFLSQRKRRNHKRPVIKKQEEKLCLSPGERCHCSVQQPVTGSRTPNRPGCPAEKGSQFTLQVRGRAGNTEQVCWFSALGTPQHWLFYPSLPFLQAMVVPGLHKESRMRRFPQTSTAACGLPLVFLQIDNSNHARTSPLSDPISRPGSQIQCLKVSHQNVKQN